jgi:hypothetical protein
MVVSVRKNFHIGVAIMKKGGNALYNGRNVSICSTCPQAELAAVGTLVFRETNGETEHMITAGVSRRGRK